MKVEISFQTQYLYEQEVSFSIHLYRLFPRAGRDVVVRRAAVPDERRRRHLLPARSFR